MASSVYWPELGLNGETLPGTGSGAAVQSVGAGSDHAGLAGIDAVLNGIREGVPITILAFAQQRNATGLVYREDAGIEDWQDLEGKTIGSFPFGSALGITEAVLQLNDVDIDTIEFVTVSPGQEMSLLQVGELEVLAGVAGAQDIWLRCLGTEADSLSAYDGGLQTYGNVIFANNEWMEQVGDEVVTRMLYGLVQGALLMKTDPEQAYRLMQEQQPQAQTDRAQELANLHPEGYVNWSYGSPSEGFGWIDPDKLRETQEAFIAAGVLEGAIDLEPYYTTEYLEDPAVAVLAQTWSNTPWSETPDDVKSQCGLD